MGGQRSPRGGAATTGGADMERGDGHEKNAQKAHESEKQPGICTWLCAWT